MPGTRNRDTERYIYSPSEGPAILPSTTLLLLAEWQDGPELKKLALEDARSVPRSPNTWDGIHFEP